MKDIYAPSYKGKICYQIINKNKKKALLFLHGGGGSINSWGLLQPYFTNNEFTQIYVDLRGHGKSYKPNNWDDYKLKKHAQDILLILNKNQIKKVILIGHCLGSMIAATFTSIYPVFVEKLILINPGINFNSIFINKYTKLALIRLYQISRYFKLKHPNNPQRVNYKEYQGEQDFSPRRLWVDYKNTGLLTLMAQMVAFFSWDTKKIYSSIKTPTLIISGKKDILFTKRISLTIQKYIKNSQLIEADTGHVSVINNPDIIAKYIKQFIQH
jgi:pimeloyl-ACP methyl ester carboxylesterase